ncbi:MAG: iron-sulfur cluster assembly scaffold protein [Deltaproteobacteria bacterium]|nr:iron-sulfur cluster assembly scaffold protein [Deltaproteobacteria bacterium]
MSAIPDRRGFSKKALDYYIERKHWGVLPDADHVSELTGSCGDSMTVYLKIENNFISDVKFVVMGCIGTITAAMAIGDLVKGRSIDRALSINDGDVFKELEEIPAQKHHCIQLAVKTINQALKSYQSKSTIVS